MFDFIQRAAQRGVLDNKQNKKNFVDVNKMVSRAIDLNTIDTSLMLTVAERLGRKIITKQNKDSTQQLFKDPEIAAEDVVCVVDNRNVDSLVAWAIISEIDVSTGRHIAYENNTFKEPQDKARAYVVLGVELMESHLKKLYERSEEIVIFAYEGSYEYLKHKKYSRMLDKVRIYWPYGDAELAQERSDNSVSKSLVYKLNQRIESSGSNMLSYIEDVARYINALPARRHQIRPHEPVIQAKLMDLHEQLQDLLFIQKPKNAIGDLHSDIDIKRYMTKFRKDREDIQHSACKEIYGAGPKRVQILTMNVTGGNFRDYLMIVRLMENSFIGYHDMNHGRVWRVYCNDLSAVAVVRDFLKPSQTWMEGSIHCMLTNRPSFTP